MPIVQPDPLTRPLSAAKPKPTPDREVEAVLGLIIAVTVAVALFSLVIIGTSLVGVVWAIIAIAQHGLTPLAAMVLLLAGTILFHTLLVAVRPKHGRRS